MADQGPRLTDLLDRHGTFRGTYAEVARHLGCEALDNASRAAIMQRLDRESLVAEPSPNIYGITGTTPVRLRHGTGHSPSQPSAAGVGSTKTREEIEVNPLGLALAWIGAAVMIVGTLLPSHETAGVGQIEGNTLIQNGDGIGVCVAAVLLVLAVYRVRRRGQRSWRILYLAGFALALVIFDGVSNAGRTLYPIVNGHADTSAPGERVAPGIGIYVTGVGAVLALLGGAALMGWAPGRFGTEPRAKRKKCPDCAESVMSDALVCKHCGYRFTQVWQRPRP